MGPPNNEHDCDWQKYALHLQKENESLANNNAELIRANESLKIELGVHKKHRFGRRSEKSNAPGSAKSKKPELTEEEKKKRRERAKERRKNNRASRKKLPAEQEKLLVAPEDQVCKRCGDFADFGEVTNGGRETEIIEQTISSLKRIVYERQKLRCRKCKKTFLEAKPPERVFPESEFGPVFVARIIVHKVLDSLPFFRQRKMLFREGLYINDNVVGDLFHKAANKLQPIYLALRSLVKKSWLILADETVLKFLQPPIDQIDKKSNRGYAWCFLDPENGRVIFQYDPTRDSQIPTELLKDSSGILVCDGYSGYNIVVNSYDRERAGCLAHARRKFVDLLESDSDIAPAIVALFDAVYEVEVKVAEVQDQIGAAFHLEARQLQSLKLLEDIKKQCESTLKTGIAPTHPLTKAMNYFLNQWPHLIKFTDDVRIPLDNNFCERTLRIVALLRKNSLFVGNAESGQRTMMLLSLAQSCVFQGINPTDYFTDVLMRMSNPPEDLSELLPENWKPPPKEISV